MWFDKVKNLKNNINPAKIANEKFTVMKQRMANY
jgi:hypothetical protein